MKFSKIILALAAGSTVSSMALAQTDLTSKKQEGFKLLIPGLYGKVELRHNAVVQSNPDQSNVSTTPALSVAPTIGTTLWGKAVDTSFTARYARGAADPTLKTTEFYNETSWKWLQGDYGSVGPYAFTMLDVTTGQLKYSNIGVNFTLEHTYPTSVGDVMLTAFTEPKGGLLGTASADTKVTPRNDTGLDNFGLAAGQETSVAATQSLVYNNSRLAVEVSPAAVKGLSIGAAIDLIQKWSPKYVADEVVDNKPVAEVEGGYEYRALTMNRLMADYKITETLKLGGEVRQYLGGVYGYSINRDTAKNTKELSKAQYESRVMLTADLF